MSDLERLRREYADREKRFANDDRYSVNNAAYRFLKVQLVQSVQTVLDEYPEIKLSSCRILEVGCGNGNVLVDFQKMGARMENLAGIDLLPDRLHQARADHPLLALSCADGQNLPFPSGSFDLLLQYTAFSSILDTAIKSSIAQEMMRVLRMDGTILWYDFWLNPTNHQTRGIRPAEIRRLFPGCRFEFHRITLAPPIARRLVPVSWQLSAFLEKLTLFNSHYLSVIRR